MSHKPRSNRRRNEARRAEAARKQRPLPPGEQQERAAERAADLHAYNRRAGYADAPVYVTRVGDPDLKKHQKPKTYVPPPVRTGSPYDALLLAAMAANRRN